MFSDLYIEGIKLRKGAGENYGYVFSLPVVKNLIRKELPFKNNVTFFVGENGTGKSTLLEAIAVSFGIKAEGGTRNLISPRRRPIRIYAKIAAFSAK